MLAYFIQSNIKIWLLIFNIFFKSDNPFKIRSTRYLVIIIIFIPIFIIIQLIHWIGFLLDEILFSSYHKTEIKSPVFILGIPRSGTTFLHHLLSKDEQFTTFSAWECFFSLSITQRKFWLFFSKIDKCLGYPLTKIVNKLESLLLKDLQSIHNTKLTSPEEDYFVFTPILACFILVIPFPYTEYIWNTGYIDRDMSEHEKQKLMQWYQLCIKKHCYVFGKNKIFLSKNAAFAPLVATITKTFPDARIICCMRDPITAIPSQFSSIRVGIQWFHQQSSASIFYQRLYQQLLFYYGNLLKIVPELPNNQAIFINMHNLQQQLYQQISQIYWQLQLDLSPVFNSILQQKSKDSKNYQSSHHYDLTEFNLHTQQIQQDFNEIYNNYDFTK